MKGPYRTVSGTFTYFDPKSIAAIVFDAMNDNTHIHLSSGTIFTIKQSQSEFQSLRKEMFGE
jgi:hypothetical protein